MNVMKQVSGLVKKGSPLERSTHGLPKHKGVKRERRDGGKPKTCAQKQHL